MKQSDVIAALSESTHTSKKDAEMILKNLGQIVQEALCVEGEIVLPGIGKFSTYRVDARVGRNPATGESVEIPARNKVKFSAAKVLKDSLPQITTTNG